MKAEKLLAQRVKKFMPLAKANFIDGFDDPETQQQVGNPKLSEADKARAQDIKNQQKADVQITEKRNALEALDNAQTAAAPAVSSSARKSTAMVSGMSPIVASRQQTLTPGAQLNVLKEAERHSQQMLTNKSKDMRNMELPKVTKDNFLWTTKAGRAAVGTSALGQKILVGAAGMEAAAKYAATGNWTSDKDVNDSYTKTLALRQKIVSAVQAHDLAINQFRKTNKSSGATSDLAERKFQASERDKQWDRKKDMLQENRNVANDNRLDKEELRKTTADRTLAAKTARDLFTYNETLKDDMAELVVKGQLEAFSGESEELSKLKLNSDSVLNNAKLFMRNKPQWDAAVDILSAGQLLIDPRTGSQYPPEILNGMVATMVANIASAHSILKSTDPKALNNGVAGMVAMDKDYYGMLDYGRKTTGGDQARRFLYAQMSDIQMRQMNLGARIVLARGQAPNMVASLQAELRELQKRNILGPR